MKKVIYMACVVAVMTTAQAKPMDQAKLSIHKNNIKVWTYQNAQNPVFLYKAETTFDVPIEKAVSLILDVDHAVKWVPYMGSVKVLSRDDKKGEFQLYMVLDFPFPLKDRDLVVQGKMTKDSQGIISIKNKAIDKNIFKNPDYVRLNHYEGDWTFQKLGSNKVKVCKYVCPTTTLSNVAKNEKSIAGTRRHPCPFTSCLTLILKTKKPAMQAFLCFKT